MNTGKLILTEQLLLITSYPNIFFIVLTIDIFMSLLKIGKQICNFGPYANLRRTQYIYHY
jgi:hypothetical protein